MKTETEYNDQVKRVSEEWRQRAEARIQGLGWDKNIAFAVSADEAANVGNFDEATIIMMTQAASYIVQSDWAHKGEFLSWWNARFPGAPTVDEGGISFASPCFKDFGSKRAGFIIPWSIFTKNWDPEQQT